MLFSILFISSSSRSTPPVGSVLSRASSDPKRIAVEQDAPVARIEGIYILD